MAAADGSTKVPKRSVYNRESVMKKRVLVPIERRAPTGLHLKVVESSLVAASGERIRQSRPFLFGKVLPSRKEAHVAGLTQRQCPREDLGALAVKVRVKHEDADRGSDNGPFECWQFPVSARVHGTKSGVDCVGARKVCFVVANHASCVPD